jgi:hypothetical protein
MRGAIWAMVLISAVPLAACKTTSSSGPPQAVVRSGGETAPADLQLACASEAAAKLNGGNSVLPVSSMRMPDGRFHVGLQLGAGQAVCVIDAGGAIQSLGPA